MPKASELHKVGICSDKWRECKATAIQTPGQTELYYWRALVSVIDSDNAMETDDHETNPIPEEQKKLIWQSILMLDRKGDAVLQDYLW